MSSPNTSTPAGAKAAPAPAHTSPAASRTTSSTGSPHPNPNPKGPSARPQTNPYSSDEKTPEHKATSIRADSINNESSSEKTPKESIKIFQSALGIPEPKPPKEPFFKFLRRKKETDDPENAEPPRKLTAANEGVYKKVLSCERTTRYKYYFCSWVVTLAMFLQIVVGASVTAFGAGQSSHILITAFGAANTALASLLAVLKSQGLPNRIRQDWNMWRELREYIEQLERVLDFSLSGKIDLGDASKMDLGDGIKKEDLTSEGVWHLVKKVEERYREVRGQIETNRPDTYIPLPPLQPIKKNST